MVIATGAVTTFAGSITDPYPGYVDGTGAAARFGGPAGIASDGAGNLYVVDSYSRTIRKIVIATASVTTLAGTADTPGRADGTGAAARFDRVSGLASDTTGNLYVSEPSTIRKIAVATATVSTLVGSPGVLGVSLGALPATLNGPRGIVMLPAGKLAILDGVENALLIARFGP